MGVIKGQSTKSTIISGLGLGIGAFNLIILFPRVLSSEQIGLTQVLFSLASPMLVLASFGMLYTVNKFFPYYQRYTQRKENDLIAISTLILTIGLILTISLSFVFKLFT